jgi:hypothetical protein
MSHAGPSITITSATNMLAFYFGSSTAIPALSDFCVFAGFCVLSLYLIVLTYFLCFVAWDLKRVSKNNRECCGLCCCKEDTICCCRGYFLSTKQKRWSGLDTAADDAVELKDMKGEKVRHDFVIESLDTPNQKIESPYKVDDSEDASPAKLNLKIQDSGQNTNRSETPLQIGSKPSVTSATSGPSEATFKTMPSLGKTDKQEKQALEVSSRLEGYLKTKVAKELFSR